MTWEETEQELIRLKAILASLHIKKYRGRNLKDLANIILILYLLCNAGIVWYFLVYKNKEADRIYEKRLKGILK